MSTDNIEISTIKLNLNGLVVELKVDQARELWAKLDELFGPSSEIFSPVVIPGPIWISESDDRITCNAYTGNTLELR